MLTVQLASELIDDYLGVDNVDQERAASYVMSVMTLLKRDPNGRPGYSVEEWFIILCCCAMVARG